MTLTSMAQLRRSLADLGRPRAFLLLGAALSVLVTFGLFALPAAALAIPPVGGHITGTVSSSGGSGIGDVSVSAYRLAGWEWDYYDSTSTDSNGAYDLAGLETGTYRLEFYDETGVYLGEFYDNAATIDGATDIPVTSGSTTSGKNGTLALAGHITGTVTNPDGDGISYGLVNVYSLIDGEWIVEGMDMMEANGDYDIGGLKTGTYRLGFHEWSGTYLDEFYNNAGTVEAATNVAVTAGSTTSGKNATLAKAGHITGTVTNSGGVGIAGVWVHAYSASDADGLGWHSATTDSNGDYDLGGLATDAYRLEFIETDGVYLDEFYDDAATYDDAADVEVTAGTTTPDIDATLADAGHITGTVTDSGGNGIAGASVNVYSLVDGEWEYYQGYWADPHGDYDAGGLPTGAYRVGFYGTLDDLGEFYDDTATVDAATDVPVTAGSTTPDINATLAPAGHITGTVTDSGGAGIQGIEPQVFAFDDGEWVILELPGAMTGPLGEYDVGDLPTGIYRVRFRYVTGQYAGEYYNDSATFAGAADIAVTAGATTSGKDAVLTSPGHVTGKVTKSGGAGIAGITVSVYEASGGGETESWSYDTSTDSQGNYHVSGLPTGTYRVRFDDFDRDKYVGEFYGDADEFDSAADVDVTAGSTTPDIDATLALLDPPSLVPVFRFRNLQNGFYLWSIDPAERSYINSQLSSIWKEEGAAYRVNPETNTSTLWRFLNIQGGYYLYTADPAEKDHIIATLSSTWRYEGPAYHVSRGSGGSPVWRFRNLLDGTYLYSADPAEKDTIVATLKSTWQLEGVAYCLAP